MHERVHQIPNMQKHSSKAAHQWYREGAIRQVGTCVIGKSTTGVQRTKMMTQLEVNHNTLSGQVVHAAGGCQSTRHITNSSHVTG